MTAPVDPRFDANLFWEARYARGGNSGMGSEGPNYEYKRDFVNQTIRELGVRSVVDFGCGDGGQVRELIVDGYYGIDISPSAIRLCRQRFAGRSGFRFDTAAEAKPGRHGLALSLDVLYHVVDPAAYADYLRALFSHSDYTLFYGNLVARDDNTPHMLFRDHCEEIENLGLDTELVRKEPSPHIRTLGFALYRNGAKGGGGESNPPGTGP